jgi:hypothetical protein
VHRNLSFGELMPFISFFCHKLIYLLFLKLKPDI